jgi:2-oxoisovalerate dehydrogenase E1 component
MKSRADIVDENFRLQVKEGRFPLALSPPPRTGKTMSSQLLVELFETQVLSRHLDLQSRKLQARGEGFYTIGSSGHEANASIAAAFRPTDMAFLHYRDAAFLIQRSKQVPGETPLWDMLLSFTASSDDPISGGRHKVLGSKALYIPPQTSTIASHLPKAMGTAYSIGLAKLCKQESVLEKDGIVLCSFGDASVNHSTAQGAINTACWTSFQGVPMPIVFVCEDNGIGISTKTPGGWIEQTYANRPGIKYFSCDGLDLRDTYRVAAEAEAYVRRTRKPAFLHVKCVRLFGHAGADVQESYMDRQEILDQEANDPLLHSARVLVEEGALTQDQILELYHDTEARTIRAAEEVILRPKLETRDEVRASLIPPKVEGKAFQPASDIERKAAFGRDWGKLKQPQNMARLINWTLMDLMAEQPNIVVAGEDVGAKGGVYSVTTGLSAAFGNHRAINTLLDEQSILGLAMGLAHNGFLPIPEIQFLAYIHNALDQIRGEASTLSFFSNGQYTNPMVVRVAGLGYQKGFGGHFHNDNSFAALRDIPGVIIACPSSGADAVEMLRECVRLAREEQRVVIFLEPIALYMTRDLHEPKDNLSTSTYVPPAEAKPIPLGQVGTYGEGKDITIVTYGNGTYLSRQAERELAEQHGLGCKIIDLRWLSPLPEESLLEAIGKAKNVLIVDESRHTGSLSEALMALLQENLAPATKLRRITADDCFIPLGRAATVPLPSKDEIVAEALAFVKGAS